MNLVFTIGKGRIGACKSEVQTLSPQRLQHLKFGEIEMKPVEENEKQLPEKENPESLESGTPSKRSISRKSEP